VAAQPEDVADRSADVADLLIVRAVLAVKKHCAA